MHFYKKENFPIIPFDTLQNDSVPIFLNFKPKARNLKKSKPNSNPFIFNAFRLYVNIMKIFIDF